MCRQIHLTRDFSHAPCTCDHTHIVAQGVSGSQSLHPHAIHDVTCLSALLVLVLSPFSVSLTSTFSLSQSTCSLSRTPASMSSPPRFKTTALRQNQEYCPVAIFNPLTGYKPNLFDDFHYSETTEIFLRSNPATRGPRTCMTRNSVTRPPEKRFLHHCSFRSEKNQRT